jgi:hypothetical protein
MVAAAELPLVTVPIASVFAEIWFDYPVFKTMESYYGQTPTRGQ